jgi:competence protein ComEC
MSDRWTVALAACAAVGARTPSHAPLVLTLAMVAAAFAIRRPWLLCIATALLTSCLAERSLAGLDDIAAGPVSGEVTLVSDPVDRGGVVIADVRLAGRRLEARAGGSAADDLRDRLAGERVAVTGSVHANPPGSVWLVSRHVAGQLRVTEVLSWRPGDRLSRAANGLRRTLHAGTVSLSGRQRSLFDGLVFGDDRAQPPDAVDDFRAAGLTHLLAVSGQNVAFVLALFTPLLGRLRLWPRAATSLALLGFFALATRFEPAVLRATAVASIAVLAFSAGRTASRLRILALAVTALLIVDPLLARSVGFALSTAASAAILVLGPRLAAVIPGPRSLAAALSVTLAAQVGVAPILISTFGPMPLATLPANLLAVPAAGPLMMWGLSAGLVAGRVGGPIAPLLHLPSAWLLAWIDGVAQRSALLPFGQIDAQQAVVIAVAVIALATGRRWHLVLLSRGALVALGLLLLSSAAIARRPPPPHAEPTRGAELWVAGGGAVLSIDGRTNASDLLAALRIDGVRHLDVVIVRGPATSRRAIDVVDALSRRYRNPLVLAPPGGRIDRGRVPPAGTDLEVGGLHILVRSTGPPLDLVVEAPR